MNIRIASMFRAAKSLERRADHFWFLSNAPNGVSFKRRFQAARLAARVLQAQGNAQMDWLCRLSTLEGAAHNAVQPRQWVMKYGNSLPGRGAAAEVETVIRGRLGPDVDPMWFSPKDTGMYRIAKSRLTRGLESYNLGDDPDDAMQMAIFGLSTSGELKKSQFWSAGKRLEAGIRSGKESPKEVAAGSAGTFIVKQFVLNRLKMVHRMIPLETEDNLNHEDGPGTTVEQPTPDFTDDVYYVMFQAMQKQGDKLGSKLREWVRSIWKAKPGDKVSEKREAVMDVWFSMWLKSGRKPELRDVAKQTGAKSHVTIKNYVDEFEKKWKRMNLFELKPDLGEEVVKRWRKTTATPPRKRRASKTVQVKWFEAQAYVNGKAFPMIGRAVSAVESILKRDPQTILMGPKMSLGPNTPADRYSEAPYALKNLQGSNVATGYSSVSLLDEHWDKLFGWGKHGKDWGAKPRGVVWGADQNGPGQLLRRQILRLAKTHPKHKATFLGLLQAPVSRKQGCGCDGGGDEVMGCGCDGGGGGDEVMGCGGGDEVMGCGDEMIGAEYDPLYGMFSEGEPADPTEKMSPEDAKKWRDNTEKNKDKFKRKGNDRRLIEKARALGVKSFEKGWPRVLGRNTHWEKFFFPAIKGKGGSLVSALQNAFTEGYNEALYADDVKKNIPHPFMPGQVLTRYADDPNSAVLQRWASQEEEGEANELYARMSPGDDPTQYMSPEDAKKWHAMNKKHRDKFKQASRRLAKRAVEEGLLGMFEEGKPADPTENMSPAQKKQWWAEHKKNKDKFKGKKKAQITLIDLPLSTRAQNMLFLGKAPWLETRPILALKNEFNREDGMASPGTVSRAVKSLQAVLAPNKRASSALKRITAELAGLASGHGIRMGSDRAPSRGGDLFVRFSDNVLDPPDWPVSALSFELPAGTNPPPGTSHPHIQLGKVTNQNLVHRGSYRIPKMVGWTLKDIQKWVKEAPGDEIHPAEYHEWALPNGTWTGGQIKIARSPKRARGDAKAILWAAWDAFAGTEKVNERDSFQGTTNNFLSGIEIEAEYGSPEHRKAEKLSRLSDAAEKRSRKWRGAWNLWNEGKSIDMGRLKTDITKTMKDIATLKDGMLQLQSVAGLFDLSTELLKATTAADTARRAFQAAINKL